jgi:Divergent InlB B-repeat domain
VKRWIVGAMAGLALVGWAASGADARVAHFQVTVSVTGPGHVTATGSGGSIDCPDSCSALILQESTIVLTATPDEGAQFTSWGGSCVDYGSEPTCTLVISGPKDVTAGFGTPPPPPKKVTLSVAKAGTGTGYVGGAGGIDCGPTCAATLQEGAKMTLLAVADDRSTFAGWSGAGCTGTGMCTVTFSADMKVTATFDHVDRAPPHIRTIRASAAPGTKAALRFRVFDDSGKSRELLTIVQGKVTIGRVTVPLGPVQYGHTYTAHWPVPRGLKPGARQYCGVAIDGAGNRSTRSCSAFEVT